MQPAARQGDVTAHGTALNGTGSTTVLIGGRPAWRMTDQHLCPMMNGRVPHAPERGVYGSSTVWIEGIPAMRVGDILAGAGGTNTIISGEPTVLIGGDPGTGDEVDVDTPTTTETETETETPTPTPTSTPTETTEQTIEIGEGGTLASCRTLPRREFVRFDASGTTLVCDFSYPDVFGGLEAVAGQAIETVRVEDADYKVTMSVTQTQAYTGAPEDEDDVPGYEALETVAFGDTEVTLWYSEPGAYTTFATARVYVSDPLPDSEDLFAVNVAYVQPDADIGTAEPTEECLVPLSEATLRTARSLAPNPERETSGY